MANHKEYRGVLKARISKIYGGDVTIDKCKKLKARKGATARDKQLCNWFINMQTNKPKSPLQKDVHKVMKINKPYARKVQILTVLEQRAKVMGKMEQARLAKAAKLKLKRQKENAK